MAALLCSIPGKLCSVISSSLNPIADLLCNCSRPFTFITLVAAVAVGAPCVLVVLALQADRSGEACEPTGLQSDMKVQLVIFACHFAFIYYVHSRFPVSEPFSAVYKRFGDMFLYDPIFALYILFDLFAAYWAYRLGTSIGAAGAAASHDATCGELARPLLERATLAVTVAYAYFFLMPICLGCALCCMPSSGSARTDPPASAGPASTGTFVGGVGDALTGLVGGGTGARAPGAAGARQPMV